MYETLVLSMHYVSWNTCNFTNSLLFRQVDVKLASIGNGDIKDTLWVNNYSCLSRYGMIVFGQQFTVIELPRAVPCEETNTCVSHVALGATCTAELAFSACSKFALVTARGFLSLNDILLTLLCYTLGLVCQWNEYRRRLLWGYVYFGLMGWFYQLVNKNHS